MLTTSWYPSVIGLVLLWGSIGAIGAAVGIAIVMLKMRRADGSNVASPSPANTRSSRGAETVSRQPQPSDDSEIVVSLQEIMNEMIEINDEQTAYLDRVNGELVTLNEELRLAIEHGTADDTKGVFDAEKFDALKKMFQAGQLLELPTKYETREFSLREEFARQAESPDHGDELLKALRGESAFRSFDELVGRLGLTQVWAGYRDTAFEKIAVGWLEANGVAYARPGS